MSSTANRIIKNTGYLYVKMLITIFLSLLTTRMVLKSLGQVDFGIFNIVGGAISMLLFLNVSMASATQRFMSYANGERNDKKQKQIFNISVVIHFGVALLVVVLLMFAGLFFFNGFLNIPTDRVTPAIIVYCSLIVSTFLTIITVPYDAVINAHENMKFYAVVGILEAVLKLLIAVIIVYTTRTDKLIVYGVLMAIVPVVSLSIMRIYCRLNYSECRLSLKNYWDKSVAREMVSFAGFNLMSTTSSMIANYGHGLVLNHFFGAILNAAFGVVQQLNGQLLALTNNMYKAVMPVIGKSAGAHNDKLLHETAMMGAKFGTALYLILALPMFVAAPYILELWLVEVPVWTVVFLRLQLIRSLVDVVFLTTNNVVGAVGRIKEVSIFSSIFNLLQLPIIILLYKADFPPYIIYIVAIVINVIIYTFILYYAQKLAQMSMLTYTRRVILPLLVNVVFSYAVILFIKKLCGEDSLPHLFTFVISSVAIYIIIFYLMFCNRQERSIFTIALKKLYYKIRNR